MVVGDSQRLRAEDGIEEDEEWWKAVKGLDDVVINGREEHVIGGAEIMVTFQR